MNFLPTWLIVLSLLLVLAIGENSPEFDSKDESAFNDEEVADDVSGGAENDEESALETGNVLQPPPGPTVVLQGSANDPIVDVAFAAWATKYNKDYADGLLADQTLDGVKKQPKRRRKIDPKEIARRKQIFLQNLQFVAKQNKLYRQRQSSYHVELNELGDKTLPEIKSEKTGLKNSKNEAENDLPEALMKPSKKQAEKDIILDPRKTEQDDDDDDEDDKQGLRDYQQLKLPPNFDWRVKRPDCVLPVVSQVTCANCYAFGALASIEWHYCIKYGERVKFSEQQCTDCTYKIDPWMNNGCVGGKCFTIFQYAGEFRYLCTNESSPFLVRADKSKCDENTCETWRELDLMYYPYYKRIAKNDVFTMMRTLYRIGPLAVEFDCTDGFNYYKGGVYSGDGRCNSQDRDHVVVITGWGYDEKEKKHFWIVRNSWSARWGEGGYIKVERGKDVCGIETAIRYPLLADYLKK